jgi:hypothetical protein
LLSIACAACSGASTSTTSSAEYAGDGSGCNGDTCDTPAGEPVVGDVRSYVDYVGGLASYDVTTPSDHYIFNDLLWAYADDDGTQYQQDLADDAWASGELGQTAYAAPPPPPPGAIREAVECSLEKKQPCKSCCEGKLGAGAALVPLCTRKCVDAKTWQGPNKPTPPPPNQPDQGITIIPTGSTGWYLYCKMGLKALSDPLRCQDQADKLCLAWHPFGRDNCLKIAYSMCMGCIALPKCF